MSNSVINNCLLPDNLNHNDLFDDYQVAEVQVRDCCENVEIPVNLDCLNLIHFNISSINAHFEELIAYLDSSKLQFDVIILSETHKVHNLDNFRLDYFEVFHNESQINKCDGTIVYVKTALLPKAEIITVNTSKFLRVSLTKNNTKIGLIAIYNSPSFSKADFVENIGLLFEMSFQRHSIEIFCGDTNINIMERKSTQYSTEYLNCLNHMGYINQINDFTRVVGNAKSCIDHIFLKNSMKEAISAKPFIITSGLTDHFPVLLSLQFLKKSNDLMNSQPNITKRIINFQEISNQLNNLNWTDLLNC